MFNKEALTYYLEEKIDLWGQTYKYSILNAKVEVNRILWEFRRTLTQTLDAKNSS